VIADTRVVTKRGERSLSGRILNAGMLLNSHTENGELMTLERRLWSNSLNLTGELLDNFFCAFVVCFVALPSDCW
jgi:hypothetical protein